MSSAMLEVNGTFLLMVAMAAVVIADILGHWARTRQLARLKAEEERLVRLRDERLKLVDTLGARRASIVAHERIVATLEQRIRWVREEIDADVTQALTIEHEIGSKAATRGRFRIRLLSASADASKRVASGTDGPLLGNLHPEIARLPNYAMIWAGSEREAVHRFGVSFPLAMGVVADTPTLLDRASDTMSPTDPAADPANVDGTEGWTPEWEIDAALAAEGLPPPVEYLEPAEPSFEAERNLMR